MNALETVDKKKVAKLRAMARSVPGVIGAISKQFGEMQCNVSLRLSGKRPMTEERYELWMSFVKARIKAAR